MAKLKGLKNGEASIGGSIASDIIVDIMRNDTVSRILGFFGCSAGAEFPLETSTTGATTDISSHNSVALHEVAAVDAPEAETVVALTVVKEDGKYKISHPDFGDGTPDALAAAAFNSPNRKYFGNFVDLVRQLNQSPTFCIALSDAVAPTGGKISGVILDQPNSKAYVILGENYSGSGASIAADSGICQVTFGEDDDSQFGE